MTTNFKIPLRRFLQGWSGSTLFAKVTRKCTDYCLPFRNFRCNWTDMPHDFYTCHGWHPWSAHSRVRGAPSTNGPLLYTRHCDKDGLCLCHQYTDALWRPWNSISERLCISTLQQLSTFISQSRRWSSAFFVPLTRVLRQRPEPFFSSTAARIFCNSTLYWLLRQRWQTQTMAEIFLVPDPRLNWNYIYHQNCTCQY